MFHRKVLVKFLAYRLAALLIILPCLAESLIITSVIAGDKKFKTISFDSKFLKPLMFESELPNTEFRRHRTLRPPKFDIDVNIPIKLPLEEDAYGGGQSEYKKPVVSDISFETGEIIEPKRKKKPYYVPKYSKETNYPTKHINFKESLEHAASSSVPSIKQPAADTHGMDIQARQASGSQPQPAPAQRRTDLPGIKAMSYVRPPISNIQPQVNQQLVTAAEPTRRNSYAQQPYNGGGYAGSHEYGPEFVPGGFVNLQLSGPTGGPKMTYEDFDREKWAQQLSQTAGAMPYPILNYHQLQNFYGGLGTFTNGLAENRYTHVGPLEKIKKILASFSG